MLTLIQSPTNLRYMRIEIHKKHAWRVENEWIPREIYYGMFPLLAPCTEKLCNNSLAKKVYYLNSNRHFQTFIMHHRDDIPQRKSLNQICVVHYVLREKKKMEKKKGKLPDTGWRPTNDIRSAKDGMKASSQSINGSFSAHTREFAVGVCNNASLGAWWH